ncbi:MAG: acyl--CoA ligase, partial [Verrucomicrobia bacterium]|nr:acyl--CoA ligase [Verrucomicrobiota bacterium]
MIYRAFMETCARHARRPALVEGEQRISYAELAGRVETLAARLSQRLRPEPGDVVAMQLPNSADFAATFFALMRLGVAAVPLNTQWKLDETRRALNGLPIKALITSAEFLPRREDEGGRHEFPRWTVEEMSPASPTQGPLRSAAPPAEPSGDQA